MSDVRDLPDKRATLLRIISARVRFEGLTVAPEQVADLLDQAAADVDACRRKQLPDAVQRVLDAAVRELGRSLDGDAR